MPLSDTLITRALESGAWRAWRDETPLSAADLTINPQSVNVSLAPTILQVVPDLTCQFDDAPIDLHCADSFRTYEFDCTNPFVFYPNRLYLASVRERFDCAAPLDGVCYYPVIDGRSTTARVGMSIHLTAGRGDAGFNAPFTLEITTVLPVRVRAGDELAQIYFEPIQGEVTRPYSSVYSHQRGPTPARLGRERFQPKRGER